MPVSKSKIASIIELGAALMELLEENPFKIRNWKQAAINIDKFEGKPDSADEQELIAALGKTFALKVMEIVATGTLQELETLKAQVPEGVVNMLNLPGLGPKKVRQLWKDYEITTIDLLREKALAGELSKFKGFGEKTQHSILEAIAFQADNAKRRRIDKAIDLATEVENYLKSDMPALHLQRTKGLLVKPETVNALCWMSNIKEMQSFKKWLFNPDNKSISSVSRSGLFTYTFYYQSHQIPCSIQFEHEEQMAYRIFTNSASKDFKHALIAKVGNATQLLKPEKFKSFSYAGDS